MAWLDSQDKNTGRAGQAPLAPTLRAKERLAPTLRPRHRGPRHHGANGRPQTSERR